MPSCPTGSAVCNRADVGARGQRAPTEIAAASILKDRTCYVNI